ncbi:hypothetical protein K3495_g10544 [Podosphaera aphanis]|nr:hypothetical protein K3495_g10544 [Podosphaera aphanis]
MSQSEIKYTETTDQEENEPPVSQESLTRVEPVSPETAHRMICQEEELCGLAIKDAEVDYKNQQATILTEKEETRQIAQDDYQNITPNLNNTDTDIEIKSRSRVQIEGRERGDKEISDNEGEDGMEDEILDKISSSPSIEDGGCTLARLCPQKLAPYSSITNGAQSSTQACGESSHSVTESANKISLRIFPNPSDNDACQDDEDLNVSFHFSGDPLKNFQQKSCDEHQFRIPGAFIESPNTPDQEFLLHTSAELSYDGKKHFLLDNVPLSCVKSDTESPSLNEPQIISYENKKNSPLEPRFSIVIPNTVDEILIFPEESSEDEFDADHEGSSILYDADSRFVDSGWGGESLQELEDINFEFVYALHTFVATIEGQANATKGDTMVLLDDSNSYWWLVRVVKDSSIGYLPAEHIETPTERLARLNKHRNIDLTSAMLGDPTERPKNSMKIAFRKRSTKTVTFSDPTYVEASDVDYSTEEEEEDFHQYQGQNLIRELSYDQQENIDDEDDTEIVEPLRTRTEVRRIGTNREQDLSLSTNESGQMRITDETLDGKAENKSRNGVLRNTDSFFQDDSVETRKITLTPNLLRDDSSPSTARVSNDSKELSRSSVDKLEKDSPDRGRDKKDKKDKKDKDKKSGMLSGLFKRKDRKNKSVDEDIDEILGIKHSNEISRNSPALSKESDEIVTLEDKSSVLFPGNQKQFEQTEKQNCTSSSSSKNLNQVGEPVNADLESNNIVPHRVSPNDPPSKSLRLVHPENSSERFKRHIRPPSPEIPSSMNSTAPKVEKDISKVLSPESSIEPSTLKAKNNKSPVDVDIYSPRANLSLDSSKPWSGKASQRHALVISPDVIEISLTDRSTGVEERLSESPVQVSAVDDIKSYPPALLADTSSQDGPLSSASSSSELIHAEDAPSKTFSRNSTTIESTTEWNDVHLRTFFDDNTDIKDLLIVVYDKSGVEPAGPGHPMIGNLFKEENLRLADMKNRLDCLLGDWLARKLRNHSER